MEKIAHRISKSIERKTLHHTEAAVLSRVRRGGVGLSR